MCDTHAEAIEAVARRFATLRDLHGADTTRWPPEAQAEAWNLYDKAPTIIADALQQIRRFCPDC